MKITEIVPAIHNKKFVADWIKHGIESNLIFPLRNSVCHAHEQEAFPKIHKLSAKVACTLTNENKSDVNKYFIFFKLSNKIYFIYSLFKMSKIIERRIIIIG